MQIHFSHLNACFQGPITCLFSFLHLHVYAILELVMEIKGMLWDQGYYIRSWCIQCIALANSILFCVHHPRMGGLCNTAACIWLSLSSTFVLLPLHAWSAFIHTITTHSEQPTIIKALSFDLLCKTFSLLARNDILECMLVSRHWRQSVPHYASACFAHLVLKNDHDHLLYSSLLEHVGIFAKSCCIGALLWFLQEPLDDDRAYTTLLCQCFNIT